MAEHVRTPDEAPGPVRPDLHPVPPAGLPPSSPGGTVVARPVEKDVATALGLGDFSPYGETTQVVVERLRDHIRTNLADARRYAVGLPNGSRQRDVAADTIAHASRLLARLCPDAASRLRLHAKAAEITARYAAAYRARHRTPAG
ncbi:DUF6415 family natural product biosynthesis protein [Streptomyces sp. NPDC048606]|uniref:DUF6415 family natural product biosynthesis protein n=1 Tax=Streptomyces sp. NPDC048606 TaxID=3154726 RepID=UPI0034128542